MTRQTALVWRLVIPVAIAVLPLTLVAQDRSGAAPFEAASQKVIRWGAWLEKYVKNPRKVEPDKTTTDQSAAIR